MHRHRSVILNWSHIVMAMLLLAACGGAEPGHPGAGGGGAGGASGGVGGSVALGGGGANDGGANGGGAGDSGGAAQASDNTGEDDGGCSMHARSAGPGGFLVLAGVLWLGARRRRRVIAG